MEINETQQKTPARRHRSAVVLLSQILSDVFSPLMVPTYAMIFASWTTVLCLLPLRSRIYATLAVTGLTAILPLLFIALLINAGKVSDRSISRRSERFIPFMFIIGCYLATAVYTSHIHAPQWLVLFYVGAMAMSLIAMAITRFWKISAHAGALGGLTGFVFFLALHGVVVRTPLVWMAVAVLLTGCMASARLVLHRHTPAQVVAGALLGFAVMYITQTIPTLL